MQGNIKCHYAILHILDKNTGYPILSDTCMKLNDDINMLLETHIERILFSDDDKVCRFFETNNNPVFEAITSMGNENFVENTKKLASELYELMAKSEDIESADVVFVLFTNGSNKYLAMLKMNYKEAYVHFVDREEVQVDNRMVKHVTMLPGKNNKLKEACVIDIDDYTIHLIEKKVTFDGNKMFYLSSKYFKCSQNLSSKSKMKVVDRVVNQVKETYFDNDLEVIANYKKKVSEQLEEKGGVHVEEVVASLFKDEQIKKEAEKKLNKYGLMEEEIVIQNERNLKIYEKQKLKTDSGIEISIPVAFFEDKERIEFINNPDGTTSILIKAISEIVSK